MANSIELISLESERKKYWDQYWALTDARNSTMQLLRAFGETVFPERRQQAVASTPTQPKTMVAAAAVTGDPKSFSAMIREACESIQVGISVKTVEQYLGRVYPGFSFNRKNLRSIISAMSSDGKLKLTKKGENGGPNEYRLPDALGLSP